jgi:hypothetical protein
VPTADPDDPDIIGPFTSFQEAKIWSESYPGAVVRKMARPEFEVLICRECEEIEAWKRRHN